MLFILKELQKLEFQASEFRDTVLDILNENIVTEIEVFSPLTAVVTNLTGGGKKYTLGLNYNSDHFTISSSDELSLIEGTSHIYEINVKYFNGHGPGDYFRLDDDIIFNKIFDITSGTFKIGEKTDSDLENNELAIVDNSGSKELHYKDEEGEIHRYVPDGSIRAISGFDLVWSDITEANLPTTIFGKVICNKQNSISSNYNFNVSGNLEIDFTGSTLISNLAFSLDSAIDYIIVKNLNIQDTGNIDIILNGNDNVRIILENISSIDGDVSSLISISGNGSAIINILNFSIDRNISSPTNNNLKILNTSSGVTSSVVIENVFFNTTNKVRLFDMANNGVLIKLIVSNLNGKLDVSNNLFNLYINNSQKGVILSLKNSSLKIRCTDGDFYVFNLLKDNSSEFFVSIVENNILNVESFSTFVLSRIRYNTSVFSDFSYDVINEINNNIVVNITDGSPHTVNSVYYNNVNSKNYAVNMNDTTAVDSFSNGTDSGSELLKNKKVIINSSLYHMFGNVAGSGLSLPYIGHSSSDLNYVRIYGTTAIKE